MRHGVLASPSAAFKDAGLVAATTVAFGVLAVLSLYASLQHPALVVISLVVPLCLAAALVLALACAGNVWAMVVFFVVLVFFNDGYFRARAAGEAGLDWQNGAKFVLWTGAIAIGVTHFNRIRGLLTGPVLPLIGAYFLFALISALYSPSPLFSFATAWGMLAMLLFALAVVATLSERQILVSFAVTLWIFVLVGWAVFFAVPELGRSPFITNAGVVDRICGIAGQANALGRVLALFLALVFLLWYRGHWSALATLPFAVTGFVTLLAADSRSSLLALIFSIAAVIARRSMWLLGVSLLGLLATFLLLQLIPLREILQSLSGVSRSGDPTEVFTLTGRTELWEFAWSKVLLSPWLGYGYNSGKFVLPQFLGLGISVEGAHNMWLENLLSVGFIGTLPLAGAFALMALDYLRAPLPMRDIFLFLVLIYGMTESATFGTVPSVLTFAIFIGVAMNARRTEQRPGNGGRS